MELVLLLVSFFTPQPQGNPTIHVSSGSQPTSPGMHGCNKIAGHTCEVQPGR